MNIHTIGIDLGKTSFHLVGLSERGEVVVRKRFSRAQLLRFTANRKVHVIGMESCGGAHFLGRALQEQGHAVRLIPAQYVKPYVKTNKNDYVDAEAIAEAVGRPTMRFVPIKSDDQLDLQSLHRVRERWVTRRTAVINQIRGLLLERGITVRKGRRYIEAALPGIGLTLNEGKTSVKQARRERFDFLGYSFGPHRMRTNGHEYLGASPSKKSISKLRQKVGDLLVPQHVAPWTEVRDRLNRVLRGWSNYFDYGTRLMAYRAIDQYVYQGVRTFLRRRHKVPTRGTIPYSDAVVFGTLGVLRLRDVHLGPLP
jgi:hypothetical protein